MNSKAKSKIPKSFSPKSEIIDYLENHGIANEEEIAKALNFHIIDVMNALLELEKEGITERINEEVLPFGN